MPFRLFSRNLTAIRASDQPGELAWRTSVSDESADLAVLHYIAGRFHARIDILALSTHTSPTCRWSSASDAARLIFNALLLLVFSPGLSFMPAKLLSRAPGSALTTCAGDCFADHNEWPNRVQQFAVFFLFWTRRYDITGQKLLRGNKPIIRCAWIKYT